MEPKIITEEFVKRLKKLDKICDHFHLSLQSGCNETLKRMNRKYSTEEFKQSVGYLRESFPNVAITTDIIVGFPGETEEEFNETFEFLKNINFSKMHVFKYSPRKGTVAEKMKGQIPEVVKEERSKKVINLSNQNEKAFVRKFIGKELDVLFEEEKDGMFQGHTTNYITVKVKGKQEKNAIKTITLTDLNGIGIS